MGGTEDATKIHNSGEQPYSHSRKDDKEVDIVVLANDLSRETVSEVGHINQPGRKTFDFENDATIHQNYSVEKAKIGTANFASDMQTPPPRKKDNGTFETLILAYQTLGVVYGDLGTSPLYVYPTINVKSADEKDFLGILSLIFWTLTMIGLIKYVFIVLHADDHGEGGTFALYSLLCRHANVGQHVGKHYKRLESDKNLSHFSNNKHDYTKSKITRFLEGSMAAKKVLLFVAMLGTCMLIGDGILTPAISVLSAMAGIKTAAPAVSQSVVVGVSATILFFLFLLQRFGTKKVSFLFSPIMASWVVTTPMIGLYNIIVYYPAIFKALSPHYILELFLRDGKKGWLMLGGTVLCITGAEAMFADLGHFDKRSIQVAFSCAVYPSVILTYAGQTAYLIKNPQDHRDAFYKSLPSPVYWPMFVISTLAAIVASQGLISASFSIIKQSVALDYFPRVKIVHTSQEKEGQIYSPDVNYILMILCLAVVLGFRDGTQIGNAFGVAVIMVMFITTVLLTLVMLIIWRIHWLLALSFLGIFASIEGVYISAVVIKILEGGWLPFAVAVILAIIMFSWNYGRQKKLEYETTTKVSLNSLGFLLSSAESRRVPGLCFFYTDLVDGVPPIISHYVRNVKSLHEVIVFITIRYIPIKTILPNERFLVGGLEFPGVYRCIAQYGYKDFINAEGEEFMDQVLNCLRSHVLSKAKEDFTDHSSKRASDHEVQVLENNERELPYSSFPLQQELADLDAARQAGAVHVVGKTKFKLRKSASWLDRILIGKIYRFLHNNCRSAMSVLIPPSHFVEVGMLYEV